MPRKTNEELEVIKKRHKVDSIWSWSRYNTYKNSPSEYYLRYIAKETPDRDNTTIWGVSGNYCHSILEDFYEGKIQYSDCIKRYENSLFEMQLAELKYDRTDEAMNALISDKYENSIRHYFRNFVPIPHKVAIEKFVLIKIGKYVFQSYLDCVYKDENGVFHILDFKTSTIYTGEKLDKEMGQLLLYSIGLRQMGVPIDKLVFEWDFLKYVKVSYEQKNGKIKERNVVRRDMIQEVPTPITMWLKHFKYDEEQIENYLIEAIKNNSFDCLPDEVKEKFKTGNAYVMINPSQEQLDEFAKEVESDLDDLVEKTKEYEVTGDREIFSHIITQKDSYFYYVLSNFSREKNWIWNNFLEELELFQEEIK